MGENDTDNRTSVTGGEASDRYDRSTSNAAPEGQENRRPEVSVPVPEERSDDSSLGQIVIGLLLIAVGFVTLFERVFEIDVTVIPLVVGLGLLFFWHRKRGKARLIAGSVVTGLGAGLFLQSILINAGDLHVWTTPLFARGAPGWVGAVPWLGMAAGFLAIYLIDEDRPIWAAIVAGVLGVLSGGRILVDGLRFYVPELSAFVFPMILIVVGILLIARRVDRSGGRSSE